MSTKQQRVAIARQGIREALYTDRRTGLSIEGIVDAVEEYWTARFKSEVAKLKRELSRMKRGTHIDRQRRASPEQIKRDERRHAIASAARAAKRGKPKPVTLPTLKGLE